MKATKRKPVDTLYPHPATLTPCAPAPTLGTLTTGKTPLHEALGVSPEYTRGEYMKIVNQDDHLPTKLKALAPLAKELGISIDDDHSNQINNITIVMPAEIATKHRLATTTAQPVIDI